MAQRTRIRRKTRRGRPQVRRAPAASTRAMRAEAKQGMTTAGGLMIGGVQDPAEKAADRMADRVMRMGAPSSTANAPSAKPRRRKPKRAVKEPEEEKKVQAKAAPKTAPMAAGRRRGGRFTRRGQGDRRARRRAADGIGGTRVFRAAHGRRSVRRARA